MLTLSNRKSLGLEFLALICLNTNRRR